MLGTIKDTIDELRAEGDEDRRTRHHLVPAIPAGGGPRALGAAQRVVVLERALAVGIGGIVSANVRMALTHIQLHGYTVIAGLGGRAITKASLRDLFTRAAADELEPLTFLDLNTELVDRELKRAARSRRSGPAAENILRDLGAVASRIG